MRVEYALVVQEALAVRQVEALALLVPDQHAPLATAFVLAIAIAIPLLPLALAFPLALVPGLVPSPIIIGLVPAIVATAIPVAVLPIPMSPLASLLTSLIHRCLLGFLIHELAKLRSLVLIILELLPVDVIIIIIIFVFL